MFKKIVILGAGLSGLSVAYFLKKEGWENVKLFEKEKKLGGLCVSTYEKDFIFDKSAHLLHFKTEFCKSFVEKELGIKLIKHKRKAYVYIFDRLIPYPFQSHISQLPYSIYKECKRSIQGCVFKNNSDNFYTWLKNTFGEGICKYFMFPFNKKFWKYSLCRIDYSRCSKFIPRISEKGYNSWFYYPRQGGIGTLVKMLSRNLDNIHTESKIKKINLSKKIIKLDNNKEESYDILISTIPLPEFLKMIEMNTSYIFILNMIKKLKWLSILNVNLGFKEFPQINGVHWIYFPQEDIPFFRISFPHTFLLNSDKVFQVSVDISYRGNNFHSEEKISQIISVLKNLNIIDGVDIDAIEINNIKYGYVIFTKNTEEIKKIIFNYLKRYHVFCLGRYGSWDYMSMEDVILQARNFVCNLKL